MNTKRRNTPAINKCARNLVTAKNLVKTWSAAGDQLFAPEDVKTFGLLGLGRNLGMLVTFFLKWGRALAACEFQTEFRVVVGSTWSGAENLVRTSPATGDQVYASRVTETGGLYGDLNNSVTWSEFAGGVQ